MKRQTLLQTTALCLAGVLAMTSVSAGAQTTAAAAEAEAAGADDIIVTARKRAEDIQTVPIAITAYTAADLAERNISNLADLGNSTPGVSITSITGGTVLGIYIRGLAPANTANDLNVDANVGIFIDGIYQTSRNTLDIISVLDVGQIDIAKGPQSALYGRSTFAGALSVATRRTAKDELEGSLTATVGEDEDYRVKGTVSGPLTETLSARIAAGYLTYDGYGKNLAAPKDNLGGTEKFAVNASLEFEPTENFKARLSGIVTHSKTELSPTTLLPFAAFNCGNGNVTAAGGGSVAAPKPQLFCGTLPVSTNSSITTNAPDTVAKTRQLALDLNWDFGPATLVSSTGLTRATNRTYNDYDGTAAGVTLGVCTLANVASPTCGTGLPFTAPYTRLVQVNALSTSRERVRTFSQELRLQSDDSSAFSWLIGGNYFDSRVPLASGGIGVSASTALAANERLAAVPLLVVPPAATGVGSYEFTANPFLVADSAVSQLSSSYSASFTKAKSIFGSLGYDFGDFRVSAEGRYNIDKKRAQVFSVTNPTSAPGVNQQIVGTTVPATGTFPVAGAVYDRKFKSFTPRFSADWQVTPNLFLYASAAKGVRSGGFNTINPANGAANGILPSEAAYDEETNWTYEGGFKSNLIDDRLLLNASVFHVDWKDAQVSGFTQNPVATTVNRIVLNIGTIKTTGFELQADFKVTDNFSVGGNFAYSDPKFGTGVYDGGAVTQCVVGAATPATATAANGCPPVIVVTRANGTTAAVPSIAGNRPQRAVKTQWNLHASANVPINDDWKATGRVDVNYTGAVESNIINTIDFGKRTLTNFRIGFESDRYSIALFGNNIFNRKYVQNSINQPRLGIPFAFVVPEIYLGETRRMGITGTVKF